MQYLSGLGGPRVMIPTSDIGHWIDELGTSPTPDNGIYGLACSINDYCGIISPWGTPLLIFGDDPSDIFTLQTNTMACLCDGSVRSRLNVSQPLPLPKQARTHETNR
jgi:hypothetical protein